jgi:FkbM family methyltransferase
MNKPVVDWLRRILQQVPLYKTARVLYNTIRYAGVVEEIQLEDVRARFSVTSGTMVEHVTGFGGEKDILIDFLRRLTHDDVVWDIGASFGMYSIVAGVKLKNNCQVIAFEPEPMMRSLLHRNLRLNNLVNVSTRPIALSDVQGECLLYPPDNPNIGTSSLVQRQDYRLKRKGLKVQSWRADTLIATTNTPAPTIVKIDVEGAECRVLRGFGALLNSPSLHAIYCEVHPNLLPLFQDSVSGVEEILTSAGFRVESNTSRGTEHHLIWLRKP